MVPKLVLDAFSVKGTVVPLQGGQGHSFKVGDMVIKKNDGDNLNYDYIAEILLSLNNPNYRVNSPCKTMDGSYIYEGFIAYKFEEGTQDVSRLQDTLHVSYQLRNDLTQFSIDRLNEVDNQWAIAMDILFRHRTFPRYVKPHHRSICETLMGQIDTYDGDLQLIHSDLGGNILFHPTQSPCVIDFSPNIAPPKLQEAIIIADTIAWEGASKDSISLLKNVQSYIPFFRYAVIFRLLSTACKQDVTNHAFQSEYRQYMNVWDICDSLATE